MIYTCDTKCCHFIFFSSAETRVCPDCGKQIPLFGQGGTEQYAQREGLALLAKMPVDPEIAQLCDRGEIESFQGDYLDAAIAAILAR